MNPNENYNYSVTAGSAGSESTSKRRRLLIILAVIIFIGLAVWIYFASQKPLQLTSTDPILTKITTQAPTLKLTFNMPLAASSASVSAIPNIIVNSSVSGNTLTLILKERTMLTLHTYTLYLQNVRSTSGRKLKVPHVSFDPKFAAPFITGEEGLINVGLTNQQVSNINTYNSQLNPWAQTVAIDDSTIKHFQLNPSDPWTPWAVSFTENIDGTNYNVVGSFYDAQDIKVTITDTSTGTQVLSAGSPGSI